MLRPQQREPILFMHANVTIEKWIVCFYRRYTVPSQAVLHAGNYITTPEEPAQITSHIRYSSRPSLWALSGLVYRLVVTHTISKREILTIRLSQDVFHSLLDCDIISMQ
jgi:hypothetical protein